MFRRPLPPLRPCGPPRGGYDRYVPLTGLPMHTLVRRVACSCLLAASLAVAADPPPAPPLKDQLPRLTPTEPADAVKTFRALDGFRMELVAHEPQVTSPVAAAYDKD